MGAQPAHVPTRDERIPTGLWLPVALALVSQLDVWAPASFNLGHLVGPPLVVSLLYVVTSMSLIWRMRHPVVVLAFIVTVDALEYLKFGAPEGLGSLLPTVVALYAVGRYARPGAITVAAPLALLGIAVHELTDPIFTLSGSNAVFYAVTAGAWPLGSAFARKAEHAERLEVEAERLAAEREQASRAAVDAERARIARELHDIVGHGLSVTVLQLVGAMALLESGRTAEAQSHLAATERSARQALSEMRRLLGLLDDREDEPGLAPKPGMAQLASLVDATRRAGATVSVSVTGAHRALPPGLDLTAYRVLQESLTNVLRHARPPVCCVNVSYEPERLLLEVRDEGTNAAPAAAGRGLTGMRERVDIFGGSLHAGPLEAGGFSVRAEFPVEGR